MKHAFFDRKSSVATSARIRLFYNCNNKTVYYNCKARLKNMLVCRHPSGLQETCGSKNFMMVIPKKIFLVTNMLY